MIHLEPEILEALGLSSQARAVEKETIEAPVGQVGFGYAGGALSDSMEELMLTGVSSTPVFDTLALPFVAAHVPEAVVQRWRPDAGVVLIEMDGGEAIGGKRTFSPLPGALYLDGRKEPAYARLLGCRGQILLAAHKGRVSAFEIIEPLGPASMEFEAGGEEPVLDIELPPLETWVEETPGWMQDTWGRLVALGTPMARLAAAGLVARLWTPPRRESKAFLARVLAGEGPSAKIGRWVKGLDPALLERVAHLALVRADTLREDLEPLADRVADDPEEATGDVRDWIVRRDDLQSVRHVLALATDTAHLDRALDLLDREAALHHTLWSAVGDLDEEERLSAVAWQEPEHWWGALSPLGG